MGHCGEGSHYLVMSTAGDQGRGLPRPNRTCAAPGFVPKLASVSSLRHALALGGLSSYVFDWILKASALSCNFLVKCLQKNPAAQNVFPRQKLIG